MPLVQPKGGIPTFFNDRVNIKGEGFSSRRDTEQGEQVPIRLIIEINDFWPIDTISWDDLPQPFTLKSMDEVS